MIGYEGQAGRAKCRPGVANCSSYHEIIAMVYAGLVRKGIQQRTAVQPEKS